MSFDDLPRAPLAHLPTPLEPLARFSGRLGDARIWIKRDDCTGLATGGNKTRKLEYLIADAEAAGADTVVTFGALQSNHARQTAAACARRGLGCDLVLTDPVGRTEPGYADGANLLMDDLLGARVHRVPADGTVQATFDAVAGELGRAGRRPYVIPTGGSDAVGTLGYVRCALEIAEQCRARGIFPGTVVHATSTGGTQAGLLAGFAMAGLATRVVGVNVYTGDRDAQAARIDRLARETLSRAAPGTELHDDAVEIVHDQLGAGYGVPTDAMVEAVRLLARTEGVLLDPVYSGKGMAAVVDRVRRGALADDVVFVHTGGTAALPVYRDAFR
jgi:L-cysteate sulfo-lyase